MHCCWRNAWSRIEYRSWSNMHHVWHRDRKSSILCVSIVGTCIGEPGPAGAPGPKGAVIQLRAIFVLMWKMIACILASIAYSSADGIQ